MNEQNNYYEPNNNEEYVYKKVMLDKQHSRAWSVASLVVSCVGLVCCCFIGWLSIVLGVLAIIFAVISRKNIGYFDGLSLAGLIVGIFGIVFGIASIILVLVVEQSGFYEEFVTELEKELGGELDSSLGSDLPDV